MNCLLLHGLGQQASAWDKVREHLPEQIHTEQPNLSEFFQDAHMMTCIGSLRPIVLSLTHRLRCADCLSVRCSRCTIPWSIRKRLVRCA